MKWLTNMKNPDNLSIDDITIRWTEDPHKTYKKIKEWLEDTIISDPVATEDASIEELKAFGMKGVYSKD